MGTRHPDPTVALLRSEVAALAVKLARLEERLDHQFVSIEQPNGKWVFHETPKRWPSYDWCVRSGTDLVADVVDGLVNGVTLFARLAYDLDGGMLWPKYLIVPDWFFDLVEKNLTPQQRFSDPRLNGTAGNLVYRRHVLVRANSHEAQLLKDRSGT